LPTGISVVVGTAPPATPEPTATQQSNYVSTTVTADSFPSTTSITPVPNVPAATTTTMATPPQIYDTVTDSSTTPAIYTTTGTITPSDTHSTASNSTVILASATHSSLAPEPSVDSSSSLSGHGVLTGVVVGCLVLGFVILTLGLWFCYRRRDSKSGSSTPIYTTKVVGDEKPRSAFAFLRGASRPWKKGHLRMQSSMSFASPMIGNEPKMMEKVYTSAPLAHHLSGSSARETGRWSTFSTSDGSAYPQTPVGTTRLSGIIMETVVETDAASNPRTPNTGGRDYIDLRRSAQEAIITRTPKKSLSSQLPPLGTNRLSMFREEDAPTPTTPTSSGGQTYGSMGHGSGSHYSRTIDRASQQPLMTIHANGSNGSNGSGSLRGTPLVHAQPKFNPAHSNGSGSVSTGQDSDGTIRITNPFLDDEDLSSYGHGMVEVDDSRSIQTMDSDAYGAYPSSNGCIPKPGPSPAPDGALTRPRSSLISDASSDYPYPLGYAIDTDGNVANPFLRISEILEEVDGRMRWPSPPLLPRAESRNY